MTSLSNYRSSPLSPSGLQQTNNGHQQQNGSGKVQPPSPVTPSHATTPISAIVPAPQVSPSGSSKFIPSSTALPDRHRNDCTPYNTPAFGVPPIEMARGGGVSGHGNGTGARGRPIGIGIAGGMGRGVPHAVTPGNTPSSLERITKRMASNLMVQNTPSNGLAGRIAPSYERRFTAGLRDLDGRLALHAELPSRSPQQHAFSPSSSLQVQHNFLGEKNGKNEWPTSFSETISVDSDEGAKVEKKDK